MKKLLYVTVALMLLGSVAWGQHQGGTISGTVMGQQEGGAIPLRYAAVSAYQANYQWPTTVVVTDSMGQYIMHVPYGRYVVKAEAMHFMPLWYDNVDERSEATIIVVDTSSNPTGIDFLLPPPPPPPGRGTISGVVMGQRDTIAVPIIAAVFAYPPNSSWPIDVTVTDRTGSYTLHVPFGGYQIRAESYHFVGLWYDNVPTRDQATIVMVDSATSPTGIDFLLPQQGPPPPPPSGISGTVTDAGTNDPIAGATVTAVDVNNHWNHFATRTRDDGTYLLGTRPGEYVVQANERDYNQAEYPTHVVVAESTIVENIDFALTAINFGSIAGMVTDTTGAGVAGAFVEARRLGMPFGLNARTDSTGAYLLDHVLPGAYRVRAFKRGYAPGVYPDSVMVTDGQDVTGIDIVLGILPPPFEGTIAGTVTDDSTGAPIGHAVVVAIGGNWPHGMFRYAFTNDDGTYLLDGLAQIPYKVFSAARGYIGEFYDNVTNIGDATPVTPNATGIDFALTTRSMGYRSFGGYVTASGGQTLEGAIVYAMANGQIIGSTITDLDGYYAFEEFEPGTYDVSVASIYGDGNLGHPLDVAFNDIPDADVQIAAISVGDDVAPMPTVSSLAQNYPNPFNARTVISFNLATAGGVELDVYNMIGQKVVTLVNGNYNPGTYDVVWDGSNASSGIYYYRLVTTDKTETKKMTLLK
jgi:hypothetical protein